MFAADVKKDKCHGPKLDLIMYHWKWSWMSELHKLLLSPPIMRVLLPKLVSVRVLEDAKGHGHPSTVNKDTFSPSLIGTTSSLFFSGEEFIFGDILPTSGKLGC